MKAAVIVFPASNCDRDVCVALERATGQKPASVWHHDSDLSPVDLIVVPDGLFYVAEAGHPRQSGQAEEMRA
jgi:phosphoribosylformylglycinamidine synthase subunit PurQ / glutaminase